MKKNKCSIITGVYGQDGSLLAEFLVSKGHRVIGLVKKIRNEFKGLDMVEILEMDISDREALKNLFLEISPDEFYHLAAVHHSSEFTTSLDIQSEMLKVNFLTTEIIIDTILKNYPKCRFLFAGSSQMYTASNGILTVDENTSYNPSTYYGITKTAGSYLLNLMRKKSGLLGATAILFNHESTRRNPAFLSRKITSYVAEIYKLNRKIDSTSAIKKIEIRDLNALVDWSSSKDIIRAMYLILQADNPRDYVLGSGTLHSVEDLLGVAFKSVNLNWKDFVDANNDQSIFKSALRSNPVLANNTLGWFPEISFSTLINEMVQFDLYLKSTN